MGRYIRACSSPSLSPHTDVMEPVEFPQPIRSNGWTSINGTPASTLGTPSSRLHTELQSPFAHADSKERTSITREIAHIKTSTSAVGSHDIDGAAALLQLSRSSSFEPDPARSTSPATASHAVAALVEISRSSRAATALVTISHSSASMPATPSEEPLVAPSVTDDESSDSTTSTSSTTYRSSAPRPPDHTSTTNNKSKTVVLHANPQIPLRRTAKRAIKYSVDENDRQGVLPHNYDFEKYNSLAALKTYLDPSNPIATIHSHDLKNYEGDDDQARAANLLKTCLVAAEHGFTVADDVDHEASDSDTGKLQNKHWNANWDKVVAKYEDKSSIELAAFVLGYRVAKRKELAAEHRLHEFFVCTHDDATASGCTSNQYRKDAARNAISNHFGRNRNVTKGVKMRDWCRKHYQSAAYADEHWQKSKRHLIERAIDETETDLNMEGKHGLTYTIELRTRDYNRVVEVATGKGEGEPVEGHNHAAPLKMLQHMYNTYCGKNKTAAEAKALAKYVYDQYLEAVTEWKANKDETEAKKTIRQDGPKYCEYQLVPEWERVYDEDKLKQMKEEAKKERAAAADPSTPGRKNKGKAVTPAAKRKREALKTEDEASPAKKSRK